MEKHQIWKTALSRLQERIDSPVFTTWISNTVALSFHKGIFVVGVQTTFANMSHPRFWEKG
jgi:chromosomal replication initiation ATPase DnaA